MTQLGGRSDRTSYLQLNYLFRDQRLPRLPSWCDCALPVNRYAAGMAHIGEKCFVTKQTIGAAASKIQIVQVDIIIAFLHLSLVFDRYCEIPEYLHKDTKGSKHGR